MHLLVHRIKLKRLLLPARTGALASEPGLTFASINGNLYNLHIVRLLVVQQLLMLMPIVGWCSCCALSQFSAKAYVHHAHLVCFQFSQIYCYILTTIKFLNLFFFFLLFIGHQAHKRDHQADPAWESNVKPVAQ